MRYIVTGRAHPERANISFELVNVSISATEFISAKCESSQLSVVVNVDAVDGTTSAFVTAEHFAQTVVSSLGFALGCGYSVEMIQVIDQEGKALVFGVAPGNLQFDHPDLLFNRALRLALEDLFFRLAVRDFMTAITESVDCATYCYRAIESIKSAFAFRTGQDRWDDMHAALQTDRKTIEDRVKDFADPIRHGNWAAIKPTSAAERNVMLVLTRDILYRYLEHVQPAAQPAAQPGRPPVGQAVT
jgi:hypothetical protein